MCGWRGGVAALGPEGLPGVSLAADSTPPPPGLLLLTGLGHSTPTSASGPSSPSPRLSPHSPHWPSSSLCAQTPAASLTHPLKHSRASPGEHANSPVPPPMCARPRLPPTALPGRPHSTTLLSCLRTHLGPPGPSRLFTLLGALSARPPVAAASPRSSHPMRVPPAGFLSSSPAHTPSSAFTVVSAPVGHPTYAG